eukprot:scaffold494_cov245-Pinguiococcus_pyrenoidosus.AAC.11
MRQNCSDPGIVLRSVRERQASSTPPSSRRLQLDPPGGDAHRTELQRNLALLRPGFQECPVQTRCSGALTS